MKPFFKFEKRLIEKTIRNGAVMARSLLIKSDVNNTVFTYETLKNRNIHFFSFVRQVAKTAFNIKLKPLDRCNTHIRYCDANSFYEGKFVTSFSRVCMVTFCFFLQVNISRDVIWSNKNFSYFEISLWKKGYTLFKTLFNLLWKNALKPKSVCLVFKNETSRTLAIIVRFFKNLAPKFFYTQICIKSSKCLNTILETRTRKNFLSNWLIKTKKLRV